MELLSLWFASFGRWLKAAEVCVRYPCSILRNEKRKNADRFNSYLYSIHWYPVLRWLSRIVLFYTFLFEPGCGRLLCYKSSSTPIFSTIFLIKINPDQGVISLSVYSILKSIAA